MANIHYVHVRYSTTFDSGETAYTDLGAMAVPCNRPTGLASYTLDELADHLWSRIRDADGEVSGDDLMWTIRRMTRPEPS